MELLGNYCKRLEDENKVLKAEQEKTVEKYEHILSENAKQVDTLNKKIQQLQGKDITADREATLDKEIQNENIVLKAELEKLKEQISKLKLVVAEQKEKIMQCENQIEQLQSDLQAAKTDNQMLLDEKSKTHSLMQKLQDTYNKEKIECRAYQDCSSSLICSNAELTNKVNAVLHEKRCLERKLRHCDTRSALPTNFVY